MEGSEDISRFIEPATNNPLPGWLNTLTEAGTGLITRAVGTVAEKIDAAGTRVFPSSPDQKANGTNTPSDSWNASKDQPNSVSIVSPLLVWGGVGVACFLAYLAFKKG